MRRAERAELFTRMSKLAEDGPVQLHFVNFTGHRRDVGEVTVRVGIGAIEILMRSRSNADRPRSANLIIDRFELQIIVKDLDSPVAPVSHVYVTFGVGRNRVGKVQLSGLRTFRSDGGDISSVLVILHYPRVTITIRDENISVAIPSHIGRSAEGVGLRRGLGSRRRRRGYYAFN